MAAKRTATKRSAGKRSAGRTSARKATKKVAAKRNSAVITDKLRKSDIYSMIADTTELSKKQVACVFDELNDIIERSVKKRAVGEFTFPGLCKIRVINKPATKARKGINPFTGEETTFKAKPARNVVKIRPLKKLKAMVI